MSDPIDLVEQSSRQTVPKRWVRFALISAAVVIVVCGAWLLTRLAKSEPEVEEPSVKELPALEGSTPPFAMARNPDGGPQAGGFDSMGQEGPTDGDDEQNEDLADSSSSPAASNLGMPNLGLGENLEASLLRTNDLASERQSMLLDALHASPIVELEPINEEHADGIQLTKPRIDDPENLKDETGSFGLLPGSIIPAVLVQGIDTTLPGIAVGMISRDVYDSQSGRTLLLPRGSKAFGTYSHDSDRSTNRVIVSWSRLDLPNGTVVKLPEVVGADQSGNAGLQDKSNRHTGRALGVTGVTSLITAGLSYAAQAKERLVVNNGEILSQPSLRSTASGELGQQYGELAKRIAGQYLAQGPTLTIRPGYEFTIQVAEEVRIEPYLDPGS